MANLDRVTSQLAGPRNNTVESAAAQLGANELAGGVRGLSTQVELLRSLFQTQTATTRENTEALQRNAQQSSSNGGGFTNAAGNVARTAGNFLGGGNLLAPVFTGLLRLFGVGGGRREETAAIPAFSLPRPVSLDGMIQAGGTSPLATTLYDQNGLPRTVQPRMAQPASSPAIPSPAANGAPSPSNVTVNINAIDSRSFLDHSDEIARAVRQAMLDSHSLNDVISEI